MAVAEMSVMTLIAVSCEKSAILDKLQISGAAQIKSVSDYALVTRCSAQGADEYSAVVERIDKALSTITFACDGMDKRSRPSVQADGFGVTKEQFFAVAEQAERVNEILNSIERLTEDGARIKAKRAELSASERSYAQYACVESPFSDFVGGKDYSMFLGTIAKEKTSAFDGFLSESGAIGEILGFYANVATVAVVCHAGLASESESHLSAMGFKRCPYTQAQTAKSVIDSIRGELEDLKISEEQRLIDLAAFASEVKLLKLYSDYMNFQRQKALVDNEIGVTQSTFVLEAYVPTEAQTLVEESVRAVCKTAYINFVTVDRSQFAPTLNRNGKVVSNFEVVTNMYSVSQYGALDPNAVMSFFFSLFMGVIMADVGYGLLMIVGGLLFAKTRREGTSVYRMAKVFACGGVFAVLFGALFDSWLGFPLLRNLLGAQYNAFYSAHIDQITATAMLGDINVPAMLMWCLGLGTVQIAVGLILKAVQCFSRGQIAQGVFGGIVWALAMLSLVVWVFGIATKAAWTEYLGYATLAFVVIGVLTAGVGEKGLNRLTKPFTSAYGVINYVSDILSYARLYGLMLSGAQIASIFTNTLAIGMLFPLGAVGVVFGVVLIVVGNVFNLAISLLGAYIHDARLQYVEFFGKFYEGEGELFTPFGSINQHSYFKN